MTGLEHSKAAESLLQAIEFEIGGTESVDDRIEIAKVHAQLATAGSIAALVRTMQRVFEHDPARAAGVRVAQARFGGEA